MKTVYFESFHSTPLRCMHFIQKYIFSANLEPKNIFLDLVFCLFKFIFLDLVFCLFKFISLGKIFRPKNIKHVSLPNEWKCPTQLILLILQTCVSAQRKSACLELVQRKLKTKSTTHTDVRQLADFTPGSSWIL